MAKEALKEGLFDLDEDRATELADDELVDALPDDTDEALRMVNAGLDELAKPGKGEIIPGTRISAGIQLRSITDIIKDLSRPLPKIWLMLIAKGGGSKITAFAWYRVVQAFDRYAPGWCSECTQIAFDNHIPAVAMRISIPCLEGIVYREDVGSASTKGYGDPVLRAKQQALKRAAAQFGFGLYLYETRAG